MVDDGSNDNPLHTVQQFDDYRVRFVKQENRGGGAARNRGIDEADGKFIAFLDSDDCFQPWHLGTMKALLDGHCNILGYAPVVADRGRGRSVVKPLRCIAPAEHMANYLLCDRGFIPTMTMVVDTGTARRVRFPENLRSAEDTDFAIRLYLEGCEFVMATQPGAVWRDIDDDGGRASAGGRQNQPMIDWIESLRLRIPARAYYGCYGWAIAKSIATTAPLHALRLYLRALWHGSYRLPVAGIVLLQIFLPDRVYRRISDTAIFWLGRFWDAKRRHISARILACH